MTHRVGPPRSLSTCIVSSLSWSMNLSLHTNKNVVWIPEKFKKEHHTTGGNPFVDVSNVKIDAPMEKIDKLYVKNAAEVHQKLIP